MNRDVSDISDVSDVSDSNNSVDTYDANFYEWMMNFAKKNKTKKHVKEGNMKLFHLFTAQYSPQMITKLRFRER